MGFSSPISFLKAVGPARDRLDGVEIGLVELVADFGEFVFGEETGQDGDAV
jgi:hypothetical protein